MERSTLALTIDNAARDFAYRKGTADEAVILHALSQASFNFAPLRRGAELADLYRQRAASGKAPLIVDAGANIGASSVYFAHRFPAARVVAIEANEDNFELLAANTADLPVERIKAILAPDAAAGSSAVTIDEIYSRHDQDALPFVVKINPECTADGLFRRHTEWVARTPVLVVALQDSLIPGSKNLRSFVDFIAAYDRDFIYLNDSVFSIERKFAA
jgi:FkbM family methyltransferase